MRALLIALGLLLALPASALEQVTLQLKWKHQFQFAGFYAAQEKGYYRDAGLDVRINEAHGNENPIETVLSGHADFGIGASELVLARGQGKPVVALATLIQHSPLTLLARHGIDTVQSLAGKRVMLVPHEIEMYAYFKREGLHPNAFEAISPSFDARDLIEGRVDAISGYSTDEPFELRNAGFRFTQMSPRAAGIDFYGDTLFTSEAQIGRHARRVAAFRDASLAGWHYAMAHPEEIADLIRAKYSQRNSRAHLLFEAEELRRLMQTDLVAIGHMYPGRWQHIADTYVELGMLPAGVSIDGLIWNPAPARLPDWVWLAFAAGALFLLLAGTAVWHYMRMAGRLGREIAERRIADQELQATRRNIAALLDATQSFAALLDLNGDILSINTHGAARFGGTCDEIVGRNIYELSTPEVGAGRRRAAEQAVRERRVIVLEDERAGRHLRSTVVPVVEENGDIRRVAVFAEDTTERTLAEIALRASEERYRFLAENTADIVWQADANLVFTYVNDAVEKLLGIPRNEAVGLPLTQLLTPESLETVRRLQTERLAADQAGQAPATAQFELELMCRDGGTVWTEISSTPIRSETGAITGYFGITRDITERKHAEHRLRAANERLTKQITEIQGLQDTLKQQVVRDSLTGLYNRRYLDETLEREIARAKREGHPLSLVMIDVDHFKRLNDTYGHQAGDQVLIALGILLRADTRTEDVPCRFGGEEFLVLMPHMSLESAKDRAELWRSRFAELSVSHGELTVGTTISLGVSAYPDHGHTPDELIQSADLALYLAKRDGRNRVVVFEPAPVLSVGV